MSAEACIFNFAAYVGSEPCFHLLLPAAARMADSGYDSLGIALADGVDIKYLRFRSIAELALSCRRMNDRGRMAVIYTTWPRPDGQMSDALIDGKTVNCHAGTKLTLDAGGRNKLIVEAGDSALTVSAVRAGFFVTSTLSCIARHARPVMVVTSGERLEISANGLRSLSRARM